MLVQDIRREERRRKISREETAGHQTQTSFLQLPWVGDERELERFGRERALTVNNLRVEKTSRRVAQWRLRVVRLLRGPVPAPPGGAALPIRVRRSCLPLTCVQKNKNGISVLVRSSQRFQCVLVDCEQGRQKSQEW